MSALARQSTFRVVATWAFICLLLAAQFIVAQHGVAHIFEKSPAQEKNENACGICLAAHAAGAADVDFSCISFPVLKPHYDGAVAAVFFVASSGKPFLATGPPA